MKLILEAKDRQRDFMHYIATFDLPVSPEVARQFKLLGGLPHVSDFAPATVAVMVEEPPNRDCAVFSQLGFLHTIGVASVGDLSDIPTIYHGIVAMVKEFSRRGQPCRIVVIHDNWS